MSLADTKRRLIDCHAFLVLAVSLAENSNSRATEYKASLDVVLNFLRSASDRDLRKQAKELEKSLQQMLAGHDRLLPRKKGVREIAQDIRTLSSEGPDIWRFGIECGWLADRFDLSKMPQAHDLPRHGKIGLGVHAGRAMVEEVSLLQDTFFMLVRARNALHALLRVGGSPRQPIIASEDRHFLGQIEALKGAVCSYARLSVLTATAFVEAFVNSVGWSAADERAYLLPEIKEELRGRRKGNYLSLESKIERLPRIIRSDGTTPIVVSDERQRREPFRRFLSQTKTVRDASVHYSQGKASILHPPQAWLQLAEESVLDAVGVAREFWSACYPSRNQPRYLAGLEYNGLLREALDRVAAMEESVHSESLGKGTDEVRPQPLAKA